MNGKTYSVVPRKLTVPINIRDSQDKWRQGKIYTLKSSEESLSTLAQPQDASLSPKHVTFIETLAQPPCGFVPKHEDADHSSEVSLSLMIYHDEDINPYQVFELSLVYQHIQCRGHDKDHVNSYFLTCQGYHGVTVVNQMTHPLMTINQHFIVFSQHATNHTVTLTESIKTNIASSFYPIFVICCHHDSYQLHQFVELFPILGTVLNT